MYIPDFKDRAGEWVQSFKVPNGKVDKTGRTHAGRLYNNMHSRCDPQGVEQSLHPSYKGCTVGEEFSDFQYFASWCQGQVGYALKGWHIDKDILAPHNTVYCEDYCVFVPHRINQLFRTHKNSSGTPKGVKTSGKKFYVTAYPQGDFPYKSFSDMHTAAEYASSIWKKKLRECLVEFGDILDTRVTNALESLATV